MLRGGTLEAFAPNSEPVGARSLSCGTEDSAGGFVREKSKREKPRGVCLCVYVGVVGE